MKTIFTIFVSLIGLTFTSFPELAKGENKDKSQISSCSALLIKTVTQSGKKFKYRAFWKESSYHLDLSRKRDINGLLIFESASFFEKNRSFPTLEELEEILLKKLESAVHSDIIDVLNEGGLKAYFQQKGTPENLDQIFSLSAKALPEKFEVVVRIIKKFAAEFYASRLRPPSDLDISQKFLIAADHVPFILGNPLKFMDSLKEENGDQLNKAKDKVSSAFLRTMSQKDKPDSKKVRGRSPTVEDLLLSLKLSARGKPLEADIQAGRFGIVELNQMLGIEPEQKQNPNRSLSPLVLFPGGVKEIEVLARELNPGAFKGFLPAEIYNVGKQSALLAALESKPGFLVTSVNAGIPIVESQLRTMLKYAEDRNFDILVFPTSQIMDGLDSRLIENPRIHIVTHTMSNDFLKLWNIPILAKNQNALASLDNNRQFKPGQTVIVGHAQLSHRNIATSVNHIRATSLWSTGSLSQNLYPHRHPIQGRTSAIAKNNHTNGFLVMEKADLDSGAFEEGTQNFWHTRPVFFVDDSDNGGQAGFSDLGRRYFIERSSDPAKPGTIRKSSTPITTLVLGDLHDAISDPKWIKRFTDFLISHPEIEKIVIHDPIDGLSHNRHEAKQLNLLIQKFKNGDLDYHKEMMGLVQFVNSITSLNKNLKVIIADSNHSYWGKGLLDAKTETQSVVNGIFLAELEHAARIYGISDPLKYVFKMRNTYIESLPPFVRREFNNYATLVSHPERIEVLPFGKNHVVGPDHRPINVNFHGHQGTNGARPSPRTHAAGSENSITGDSHQSYILGNWMSVGTSTPLRVGYNDGGYSSWSNSFAVIYEDGTKQLVTYSPLSQTFAQRAGVPVPDANQFFGDSPLEIQENDNDLVDGEVTDQFSHHLDLLGVSKTRKK